jgi:hypothetical protein
MVLTNPQQEEENDELLIAVQIELDKAVTKEVCDAVYETAALPPQELTRQNLDAECKTRKTVIMGVISNSVNLERLYFIVRSSIMGGMTGILTFAIISLLKVTSFLQLAFIGVFIFVVSLVASRVFDKSVVRLSNLIIAYLGRHKKIKEFILKRL